MSDPEGSSTPEMVAPALRMDISMVSLKILPFWPADPEVWFSQVEATFTTRYFCPANEVRPYHRLALA